MVETSFQFLKICSTGKVTPLCRASYTTASLISNERWACPASPTTLARPFVPCSRSPQVRSCCACISVPGSFEWNSLTLFPLHCYKWLHLDACLFYGQLVFFSVWYFSHVFMVMSLGASDLKVFGWKWEIPLPEWPFSSPGWGKLSTVIYWNNCLMLSFPCFFLKFPRCIRWPTW